MKTPHQLPAVRIPAPTFLGLFLIALVSMLLNLLNVSASPLPAPHPVTCTDAQGRILYTVDGIRITGPQGQFLGTCTNGEIRDAEGRLIAHNGDPGLLYKFVASGHTP